MGTMGASVLNHVAMSLPRAELDASCEEILRFFGELFGWHGYRGTEAEGAPLIMVISDRPQFVFVYGDTEATRSRPMDHFSVQVQEEAELDAILERARDAASRDERVRVIDKDVTPAGPVEVVSCYIGFVLPLMVEVQYFRRPSA